MRVYERLVEAPTLSPPARIAGTPPSKESVTSTVSFTTAVGASKEKLAVVDTGRWLEQRCSSRPRVLLAGPDLEFLRAAIMAAMLAPAADAAASSPANADAVTDVRAAAALLSRIGWPGDPAEFVGLPFADVSNARRAMLVVISGAVEGALEEATTAPDADRGAGGVSDALAEVDQAAHVLRRLDGRDASCDGSGRETSPAGPREQEGPVDLPKFAPL